jgi:hypothetical protein
VRAKATELNPSANVSKDPCVCVCVCVGGWVGARGRGRVSTDKHLRHRGEFQPASESPCAKNSLHFTTLNLYALKHTHSRAHILRDMVGKQAHISLLLLLHLL